jgi:hypothetical protein
VVLPIVQFMLIFDSFVLNGGVVKIMFVDCTCAKGAVSEYVCSWKWRYRTWDKLRIWYEIKTVWCKVHFCCCKTYHSKSARISRFCTSIYTYFSPKLVCFAQLPRRVSLQMLIRVKMGYNFLSPILLFVCSHQCYLLYYFGGDVTPSEDITIVWSKLSIPSHKR